MGRLDGFEARLFSVAYSPDGHLLAVGGDNGTVWTWRADGKTLHYRLDKHKGRVRGLAFSPNSRWLASVGQDHEVRVWDMETGKQAHALSAPGRDPVGACHPQGAIHSAETAHSIGLAFHPTGKMVAAGGSDGVLRLWPLGSDTGPAALRWPGRNSS